MILIASFDWNTFWVSFWASLASGLCYSLFVTFTIGVVLWKLQTQAEKKSLARQQEQEIASFTRRLKSILDKPVIERANDILEIIPFPYDEAEMLINDKYVSSWNVSSQELKSILDLVVQFQQKISNLKVVSGRLFEPLNRVILEYREENQIPRLPVSSWTGYAPYYLRRVYGYSESEARKDYIGFLGPDAEIAYNRIHSDVEVSTYEVAFTQARREIFETASHLKILLGSYKAM